MRDSRKVYKKEHTDMVDPNKSYVNVTKSQMTPKSSKPASPRGNGIQSNPYARPLASTPKAPTSTASSATNKTTESQAIFNEYMKLLDEASDFANESTSGKVPLKLATVKTDQFIRKLIALGLRSANHYG